MTENERQLQGKHFATIALCSHARTSTPDPGSHFRFPPPPPNPHLNNDDRPLHTAQLSTWVWSGLGAGSGLRAPLRCCGLAGGLDMGRPTTGGPRAAADRKLGERREREGAASFLETESSIPFFLPALSLPQASRYRSTGEAHEHRGGTQVSNQNI